MSNPTEFEQPSAVRRDDAPQDDAGQLLEVHQDKRLGQLCLKSDSASSVSRAAGEAIVPFRATATYDRPARMTLQVSEREHIELAPVILSFTNHSCDPTAYFDVELWALIALQLIAPGDPVTFFYPSTEWTMASPFDCLCGSPRCLRQVAGASQVPEHALQGHRLAPHITELLRRR